MRRRRCTERALPHVVKSQNAGVICCFGSLSKFMNHHIDISYGNFSARFLSLGATLNRFQFGSRDLILGVRTPDAQVPNPIYAGAIVGPVANRITRGQIDIDGKTWTMPLNENGETTLHSGTDGLHAVLWDVQIQEKHRVVFECTLRDSQCGLPGNRKIAVEYALDAHGLKLVITAVSDQQTPMNIAHHPYWVLDDDQSRTKLQITADRYLPISPIGLPDGEIAPVAGTFFDFLSPAYLGESTEIDHNFCLSTDPISKLRPVAQLIASDGLTVDIETTEPGLQVYTGATLPDLPDISMFGGSIRPYGGIAIEAQGWPDAPNNSNFPSIFINAGEVYRQETYYRIAHA